MGVWARDAGARVDFGDLASWAATFVGSNFLDIEVSWAKGRGKGEGAGSVGT